MTAIRPELMEPVARLYDDVLTAAAEADRERLIRLHQEIEGLISELRTVGYDAEQAAVPLIGFKEEVMVDGLGAFKVSRKGNKTTWDHERTATHAVDAWMAQADDIGHPKDVALAVLKLAGVSYWRVTELKALGLDVDALELRDVVKGTLGLRKA